MWQLIKVGLYLVCVPQEQEFPFHGSAANVQVDQGVLLYLFVLLNLLHCCINIWVEKKSKPTR